jgi:transcriptional regulator of acetoin/glycerol metabolism
MMAHRRRRRPVNKLDTYVAAKALFARGWPPTAIARHLGVSRTTVWYWRHLSDHDHEFKALLRRVLLLSETQRSQLLTSLTMRAA